MDCHLALCGRGKESRCVSRRAIAEDTTKGAAVAVDCGSLKGTATKKREKRPEPWPGKGGKPLKVKSNAKFTLLQLLPSRDPWLCVESMHFCHKRRACYSLRRSVGTDLNTRRNNMHAVQLNTGWNNNFSKELRLSIPMK